MDTNTILHHEQINYNKRKVQNGELQNLTVTIPIEDTQMRDNFQLRIVSNDWMVEDTRVPLSMNNYVLPETIRPHTDLLDLEPLPISALKNVSYQNLYGFQFFNPVQTQVFFSLYHTWDNILIGAPTSSGKTLCAELAIFRLLQHRPGKKCVYIAPLKALVRERVKDWKEKFAKQLGVGLVEVSGDHTPSLAELEAASILVTTPEKWDGITRSYDTRTYVRDVNLVIIDEIHLLGVERGAVLEAIVTRMKIIARRREQTNLVRLVGLSTALANAGDIADWLGVPESGLYNFRPSVRPVPIDVHIQGFHGQHYCPRMALMNKPAFKAIKQFSPVKPTLVFVASPTEADPKQWLHMEQDELQSIVQTLRDENLKITLPFGIGIHHAGINCPAHLVIVKGTEYYDGKTHKYVDFPVTDALQMIGRAGRPQYDTSAVAVVYVQDVKKRFYKCFLYEPFPVESSLLPVLPNHVNAEVCSGSIASKQQIVEYLAGTYLYRRLFANPNDQALVDFLTSIVDLCINELVESQCLMQDDEDPNSFKSTPFGTLASKYYLEHMTIRHFAMNLRPSLSMIEVLQILTNCPEYGEIPVRHNEDNINMEMNHQV
ncbi:Activating signal cointegrator 1 complex subunit 3 [Aphelenchoides besseyi]|nr:Activating signal cointegrator 1 complex subunit 3 [Aphelenchoides besseyi]